jgi:hypothetical protein
MRNKPNIPDYLLWEYDLTTFNYEKSYKIVIERILSSNNIEYWNEMLDFYPLEKVYETIKCSEYLTKREKDFANLFLQSDLLKINIPK